MARIIVGGLIVINVRAGSKTKEVTVNPWIFGSARQTPKDPGMQTLSFLDGNDYIVTDGECQGFFENRGRLLASSPTVLVILAQQANSKGSKK